MTRGLKVGAEMDPGECPHRILRIFEVLQGPAKDPYR